MKQLRVKSMNVMNIRLIHTEDYTEMKFVEEIIKYMMFIQV